MKAARLHSYGGPDVFQIDEIDKPEPGPGQILVRARAAAVNPIDYKIRRGYQRAILSLDLPAVIGMDVAGVVTEVGPGVTEFEEGDEVYSSPSHKRQGCYAEYVAVQADEVALKPDNLSFEEAAALPMVALTAWACIVDAGPVEAGDIVFVQGGSGGVGTMAIQMAKHFGATVTTTCSEPNFGLVSELGADRAIDYRSERFENVVETPQDLVIDMFGGEVTDRLLGITRRGGTLAYLTTDFGGYVGEYGQYLGTAAAALSLGKLMVKARLGYGVRAKVILRKPDGRRLAKITDLVEQGALRPIIDEVFPLSEVSDAHRKSESGHAKGKIILRM